MTAIVPFNPKRGFATPATLTIDPPMLSMLPKHSNVSCVCVVSPKCPVVILNYTAPYLPNHTRVSEGIHEIAAEKVAIVHIEEKDKSSDIEQQPTFVDRK